MKQTLATSVRAATTTRYAIDPTHTTAEYSVRHMFTNFRGAFRSAEGTIEWNPERPDLAVIDARVDVTKIDTGLADRDAHLRSADFFDAENHPHMTFRAEGLTRTGINRYHARGELTLRGVTRPLDLDVEFLGEGADAWGGWRAGAVARGSLNRKEFGMVWSAALDKGGVVLGDKVDIELHVEAVRAA